LTTFGGDMVVPPNTIDFGSVFSKFNIGDNPAVFATVVSVLGLYVFVALYARYKDKKDIIKVRIINEAKNKIKNKRNQFLIV